MRKYLGGKPRAPDIFNRFQLMIEKQGLSNMEHYGVKKGGTNKTLFHE